MNDGPVDRFARSHRAKRVKQAENRARNEGLTDREAEQRATEQEQFLCRECRKWCKRAEFEYTFDGEVRLATRCETCRWILRQKRKGRF